ncbi:hypothetical protein M758_1G039200 [Ceratodon purpureus]|nr:hypothetical protein M758_1G039200 [Ceratodon purpureus]
MTTIMIETPIAFGLTMIVCLALFIYCWRIRKIRNRLTTVQVSATPIGLPLVQQTGIKKEVIISFPTVKASDLKVDIKEGLQCPICLVEYSDTELLRKLPLCGHVFHIRCVDSWLEKQVTCPVCRIVLTAVPKVITHDRNRRRQQSSTNYWRVSSIPESVAVEVTGASRPVPGWVLVNRPMPLPPAILDSPTVDSSSSSSSDPSSSDVNQPLDALGESPLLQRHSATGWGAVYLEKSLAGLSFRAQSKECVDHSSISERWMTESFFFGLSASCSDHETSSSAETADQGSSSLIDASMKHSRKSSHNPRSSKHHDAAWSSDRSVNSSWDFNQPSIHSWQTDYVEDAAADEVFESRVAPHRPLTMCPERCSFEFLPIITGPGGDYSLRPPKSPRGHW